MQNSYFLKDIKWLIKESKETETSPKIIEVLPFLIKENGKIVTDLKTNKVYTSKRTYSFEKDILEQVSADYNCEFKGFNYCKAPLTTISNNVELHAGEMTFMTFTRLKEYLDNKSNSNYYSVNELIKLGEFASKSENEIAKRKFKLKNKKDVAQTITYYEYEM